MVLPLNVDAETSNLTSFDMHKLVSCGSARGREEFRSHCHFGSLLDPMF